MFHVKHEGWEAATQAIGVTLAPEDLDRLGAYERLLVSQGAPMGLISPGDVARVRERHILDSLRAAALIGSERATAYDLGSGGGLPGIVLAIARPNLVVTLVEVRRNRAAFLQMAIEELALEGTQVHARRAETLRDPARWCFARAFAPAAAAWAAAAPILEPGGGLIYWAGRTFASDRDVPPGVLAVPHQARGLPGAGPLVELTVAPDR
jgi:16S rRNA (guanine527-N7)-methyltransferase